MKLLPSRHLLCLGLTCTLCGCLGRAVVGDKPHQQGDNSTRNPTMCEAPKHDDIAPRDVPERVQAIDLSTCDWQDPGPPSWHLESTSCSSLDLKRGANDPPEPLQAASVQLHQVNLRIVSSGHDTIEITQSELDSVYILSEGQLTLRLAHDSSSNIQLSTTFNVDITLEDESIDGLAISAPAGQIHLRGVELQHARIEAQHIDIEDSTITDAVVMADELDATDSMLERFAGTIRDSVLTRTAVTQTELADCIDTAMNAEQGR